MFKKVKGLVGVIFAFVFLVIGTGCAADTETAKAGERETIEVEHESGTTTVKVNPQNVVVMDYGPLDTLHFLGADIVGVPQSSSIPAHLSMFEGEEFANAGSLSEPDFEAIFEMEPELIVIGGRLVDYYEELSEIAPTIHIAVGTDYMAGFERNVRLFGEIFDKQDVVEAELASISERVEELNAVVTEREREALVLLVNDGNISNFGSQSRFGIIFNTFGFVPVADNDLTGGGGGGGEEINFEFILENDPEYIFVIDRGAILGHEGASDLLNNELVNGTRAAQNDNIISLNNQVWHTAPGGVESTSIMIDEVLVAVE